MISIDNVVSVSVLLKGSSAKYDNLNNCALLTDEVGKTVNYNNRFKIFKALSEVSQEFGVLSNTYDKAKAFFSTSPNPISVGGNLIIFYYPSQKTNIEAIDGKITGSSIDVDSFLNSIALISDGSYKFGEKGAEVAGLDFKDCFSVKDVVKVLGEKFSFDSKTNKFSVNTSQEKAEAMRKAEAGTYIGSLLGLDANSDVELSDPVSAGVAQAETAEYAVDLARSKISFYGYAFATAVKESDQLKLATWSEANGCLGYGVFSSSSALTASGVPRKISLAGLKNYRCFYSYKGNIKLPISAMARTHTVDFNASNSAMTLHGKTLATETEEFDQTVFDSCQNVGLDIYTEIKNVPFLYCSGANNFVDTAYNLLAMIDTIKTNYFNLLKTTTTKIGQDEDGREVLLDCGENSAKKFVRSGVLSAGTWTGTETIGDDRQTMLDEIEKKGYYWVAGKLADQSFADRQARKSVALQGAFKLKGAIHSINVILNVED